MPELRQNACIVLVATLLTGCTNMTYDHAGEPPPPAQRGKETTRRFSYRHELRTLPARRHAVAILRVGDTREVEDVPFGETHQDSQTVDGDGSVGIWIESSAGGRRAAPPIPHLNASARALLRHVMVESGSFLVVERERILEILREVNFGKTGYVDPATKSPDGAILSARYLVEGFLTVETRLSEYGDHQAATGFCPGFAGNVFGAADDASERFGSLRALEVKRRPRSKPPCPVIACYLSLYDAHTGQVAATVLGFGQDLKSALEEAVDELALEMGNLDTRPVVAGVQGETVYVDGGAKGGIHKGDQFLVNRRPGPDAASLPGAWDGEKVAEIKITEVEDSYGVARVTRIVGGQEIRRGDVLVSGSWDKQQP